MLVKGFGSCCALRRELGAQRGDGLALFLEPIYLGLSADNHSSRKRKGKENGPYEAVNLRLVAIEPERVGVESADVYQ